MNRHRPSPWAPEDSNDDGFSLVEVIVALALILIIMVPVTTFFLKTVAASRLQTQRQAATVLAGQTMELARAVEPSKLKIGRTPTAVAIQTVGATSAELDQTAPVVDGPAATVLQPALLPLSEIVTVGNTPYTIRGFVGRCWRANDLAAPCVVAPSTGSIEMYRVTVSVVWTPGRGQSCGLAGGLCESTLSTLVDPMDRDDPFFDQAGG